MPCNKAQTISKWFLKHLSEFSVHKQPPPLPHLRSTGHLWDVVEQEIMDVQLSNLQELHDVVLSIWTKMSEAR